MSSAVPKRPAKLLTIRLPKAGKARILKFDRHAGVIVVEKTAPTSNSGSLVSLVRNLLSFLKPKRPAAPISRSARQR